VIVIVLTLVFLPLVQDLPADPGHGASVIGSGTFEAGNFTFPNFRKMINFYQKNDIIFK